MDVKHVSFGMFVASVLLVLHGAGNLLQFDIILKEFLELFHHYFLLFANFKCIKRYNLMIIKL